MSANFTPTLGEYTRLTPFRFWCQKVLPLVYDDSLSYYELLNKVVDYLNKTMEDVDTMITDVDALHDAYDQLQQYVNDYFDNLDVQTEINNKLDQMAEDGSLDALIEPYLQEYREELNSIIAGQNADIAVLQARMDTFASLPDGSTAGDAELTDIRVGAIGYTYPTAGDAVRDQVSGIFRALTPLPLFVNLQRGYYAGADGQLSGTDNSSFCCTDSNIAVGNINTVTLDNPDFVFYLSYYDSAENYIGYSAWSDGQHNTISIKNGCAFFTISVKRPNGSAIYAGTYTTIRDSINMNAWTDNTLGIKYKAADAGAVNIALSQIHAMLSDRSAEIPFYLVPNAYLNSAGKMVAGYNYAATNYIHIDGYESITLKRMGLTGAAPVVYSAIFYDDDYNVILQVRAAASQPAAAYVADPYTVHVPIGAKYVRFTTFKDTDTYGVFTAKGLSKPLTASGTTEAFTTEDDTALMTSVNDVIAAFEALRGRNSDYMTQHVLQTGNTTLYEYVLTTGNYNDNAGRRSRDSVVNKPKILIVSGIHGNERASVSALYKFVAALCNKEFPLSKIITGAELHIIPVGSPTAFDADTRLNNNSVNINRNFATSNWTPTPAGDNYSGLSAGDQEETQIMQQWIQDNDDALLYIDWHNSSYVNELSCLLGTSTADEAVKIKHEYLTALNEIIPYWQLVRGIAPASNIYGYTGGGNPGTEATPGTSALYALEAGITCAYTMETSWNINGSGKDSAFTIATSAEAAANVLREFSFLAEI